MDALQLYVSHEWEGRLKQKRRDGNDTGGRNEAARL
jgi:hypothetical protein